MIEATNGRTPGDCPSPGLTTQQYMHLDDRELAGAQDLVDWVEKSHLT
jgi:hypothetical protein